MGLIKAGMGALGGTLADQWKEFFYCDSLDKDVLMVKGQKRTSRRSSCLLYTSDAADEEDSVDLGGRRILKKKKNEKDDEEKEKKTYKMT